MYLKTSLQNAWCIYFTGRFSGRMFEKEIRKEIVASTLNKKIRPFNEVITYIIIDTWKKWFKGYIFIFSRFHKTYIIIDTRKKCFKGYIFIFSRFHKIATNNFNLDPCFFNLVKLGTILAAPHFLNCVNIGKSLLKLKN